MITRYKLFVKGLPILMSIFTLICFSCENVDQGTSVTQKQFEYPVLKSKEFNHVLNLNIIKSDSLKKTTLKKVLINLKGTTKLDDIESVALYYDSDNKGFLGEGRILFAETTTISSIIELIGDIELKGHHNNFWLSYKLKDNADILGHIGAQCEKVFTNYGEAEVKKIENPIKLRIGVAVRQHMQDSVHTYRIPGLTTTSKGTLLASYDVRRDSRRDLQGNIDIGISRSVDGGQTWEPMRIALDMGTWGNLPEKFNGVSDANLLATPNGDVYVAGLWMYGVIDKQGIWKEGLTGESTAWNHQWRNKGSQPGFGVKETSQFLIAKSVDDGITWGEPINITKMVKQEEWWLYAPSPGHGIVTSNGTLVFPTQGRNETGETFSNITYSNNYGKTWKSSKAAYTNTTESMVVQLDDGSLMLNMRDNRNRKNKTETNGRAIAITNDFGENWEEHPTSHGTLIEPVCMASLHKHLYKEDGIEKSILLFSNPNSKFKRNHMTIKVSFDNGETWPEQNWLLLDEGLGRGGYSCITSIDEDTIGILYESSQADMTFQKIPIKDILSNPK
jgi:sialidase-1